jgi:hypothetical protein|tara:strand:+ start:249 stop:449 length:201 start_codon:yes stop_codon:yes gene_type:complete
MLLFKILGKQKSHSKKTSIIVASGMKGREGNKKADQINDLPFVNSGAYFLPLSIIVIMSMVSPFGV